MDDWLILSGGALFFGFIIGIFYWLYNRNDETEFDTRYPRATLELLAPKKKQQQQQAKKSNKKKAEKAQVVEQPAVAKPAPAPAPKPQQQQPQQSQQQQPQQQPQAKPAQPEQPVPAKVEKPVEKPGPSSKLAEPVEPVQQVKVAEPVQAEPPKEVKKPAPKPVNSSDLDQKKVLSYLSKRGDIDTAYVTWLTTSFQQHETQLNHRKTETQSLDKKNRELTQRVEKLQKDKQTAEARAKEEQTQRLNVASKLQSLQARETELARQNQAHQNALQHREQEHGREMANLRSRNEHLERELASTKANNSRNAAGLKSAQLHLRETQNQCEDQTRKHNSIVMAYEADKKKTSESVAELNKVVTFCEQELAKTGQQFLDQAKQIAALNSANKDLQDSLQAAKLALDNQSKHGHEDIVKLEEEQKQWLAEKEQMTEKYVRLEELIKELNSDMTEFHLYFSKDQQEKIVSELNQREQSRLEELGKEQEKGAELVKQLQETKAMLAKVRKSLEEADLEKKKKMVEIPKNSEPVEEVFELKKTTSDLAAAPSTSSSVVEELKAKNAELDAKNMELRQRNMTILEKTEAVPNQLVATRKQVATEIGKLTKKAFKSFNDEEAFQDWLSESVSDIQKNLSSTSKTAPAAASAPAKAQKSPKATTSDAQNIPEGNEHVCRNALISLIKELDHINDLVDKQEREHAEEVARLRAQLA